MRQLGSSRAPEYFGLLGKIGSTIASQNKREHFFTQKQHGPFPDCLRLPYSHEEILSGFKEDVPHIRDGFTTWVEADFETVLERHIVDVRKARAEFREASAFRHANMFHVTHHGGCAVLFKKGTFFPDVNVTSMYFHDNKNDLPDVVFERESGLGHTRRAITCLFSATTSKGPKNTHSDVSLHINNNYAEKRGIRWKLLLPIRAVMLDENVNLVAGDFNGAAWRRTTCASALRIIEQAFADCDWPLPSLWGPGAVPDTLSDVVLVYQAPRL